VAHLLDTEDPHLAFGLLQEDPHLDKAVLAFVDPHQASGLLPVSLAVLVWHLHLAWAALLGHLRNDHFTHYTTINRNTFLLFA